MPNLAHLATRYARRPLLIEPTAATELLRHLAQSDPRGMRTESRLEAVLRKVGLGRGRTAAWDDDDYDAGPPPPPPTHAYTPLWAQQMFGDPEDEGFCWALYQGAALMQINTAIDAHGEYYCGEWYHGYDTILAGMREAIDDARVKGLFIRMDTPGGVVTGGLSELAQFIRENRESAGGKPIHFHCDMSCSAGYYFTAQGDWITAPKVGLVGSIGAVMLHVSQEEALNKAGLVVTSIEFPADGHKTDGASWKALSPSARADFMAEVAQCGRDFIADVVAGRPAFTATDLLATQARVFLADHDDAAMSGLKLGFVDAICSEEQAFATLLSRFSSDTPAAAAPRLAKIAASSPRSAPQTSQEPDMSILKPKTAAHRHPAPTASAAAPIPTAATPENPVTDPDEGMTVCESCNGTGSMDGEECPDCDGEGQVEIDQGERTATTPAATPQAAADRAQAIAASPEASANPQAALAAIKAGLTLEQFKTMAAVPAQSGTEAAIDRRMRGAQRLGADAVSPMEGKSALGAALMADAKAKRDGNK
jgi:ClpP class serine protease